MLFEKLIVGAMTVLAWGALYYGSWVTTHLKVLPSYDIWLGEILIVLVLSEGYFMLLVDSRESKRGGRRKYERTHKQRWSFGD